MAGGWTRDGAVQDQIEDTLRDALRTARSRTEAGVSAMYCSECGERIPEARRIAVPGVLRCVTCQSARE